MQGRTPAAALLGVVAALVCSQLQAAVGADSMLLEALVTESDAVQRGQLEDLVAQGLNVTEMHLDPEWEFFHPYNAKLRPGVAMLFRELSVKRLQGLPLPNGEDMIDELAVDTIKTQVGWRTVQA
jgi:hypothetical protein